MLVDPPSINHRRAMLAYQPKRPILRWILGRYILLQVKGIKRGGENKFAGYKYYELEDFVPIIHDICKSVRIIPMVTFPSNAVLTIVDLEKPEDTIIFSSPMSTASLKGCHEVQNLGRFKLILDDICIKQLLRL